MADFKLVIEKTLKHEGGYNHISGDAGGETNFGISQRAYPSENIKTLTKERACEIYKRDYWDKVHGDKIVNQAKADILFDTAVNMGVSRAVKIAQEISKSIPDGIMGTGTLVAIAVMSERDFVNEYKLARIKFYCGLCTKDKTQMKFLLGWINRVLS